MSASQQRTDMFLVCSKSKPMLLQFKSRINTLKSWVWVSSPVYLFTLYIYYCEWEFRCAGGNQYSVFKTYSGLYQDGFLCPFTFKHTNTLKPQVVPASPEFCCVYPETVGLQVCGRHKMLWITQILALISSIILVAHVGLCGLNCVTSDSRPARDS